MKLSRMAFAIVTVTVALAGCGDGASSEGDALASAPESSKAASPMPDARYGTVEALKEAAVAAGYDCRRWRQDDAVTLAAQSGTCSGDSVFATFSSEGDLQRQIETYRELDELGEELDIKPDPRLVGPNWVINVPEAASLQPALGGTVENE